MPRRNFRELEARMGPERIAERNSRVDKMIAEMPLNRVREARNLTQEHLASILHKDQSAISQRNAAATCTCGRSPALSKPWAVSLRSAPTFPMAVSESRASANTTAQPGFCCNPAPARIHRTHAGNPYGWLHTTRSGRPSYRVDTDFYRESDSVFLARVECLH